MRLLRPSFLIAAAIILLVLVDQTGPACHTNRRSCFYTGIRDGAEVVLTEPMV